MLRGAVGRGEADEGRRQGEGGASRRAGQGYACRRPRPPSPPISLPPLRTPPLPSCLHPPRHGGLRLWPRSGQPQGCLSAGESVQTHRAASLSQVPQCVRALSAAEGREGGKEGAGRNGLQQEEACRAVSLSRSGRGWEVARARGRDLPPALGLPSHCQTCLLPCGRCCELLPDLPEARGSRRRDSQQRAWRAPSCEGVTAWRLAICGREWSALRQPRR